MKERKNLAVKLLDDKPGSIAAVFATLNVIDKDEDVTIPGAFEAGAAVNIAAWGHNWGDLPSGDGRIREAGDQALFEGAFYLGTPQGDATHETLKQRLERGIVTQEWSYGFDVLDWGIGQFNGRQVRFLRKLKVFEVSPVMLGAGEGTRTLDVKSPFSEQADRILGDVTALIERASAFGSSSAKEGRTLSTANVGRLRALLEALDENAGKLRELLDTTDPEKEKAALGAAYFAFLEADSFLKGGFR